MIGESYLEHDKMTSAAKQFLKKGVHFPVFMDQVAEYFQIIN